ncbi:uncharacterized protein LOC122077133 isoform X1 [Macadamia integrifolia]|uniref:uncharacterized protein LOC122077133 isoform X1 n=1 Tax=Macadamia integrifolia TaxID=60698 RepID=UPI001C4EA58E|nr:uncharacterized protein LOC122077133 isoform X1 [Macadamia integrifolia]
MEDDSNLMAFSNSLFACQKNEFEGGKERKEETLLLFIGILQDPIGREGTIDHPFSPRCPLLPKSCQDFFLEEALHFTFLGLCLSDLGLISFNEAGKCLRDRRQNGIQWRQQEFVCDMSGGLELQQ